ncbi:MAG: hypothetical protein KGL39_11950 [Patescibacteria group bacterium]|nr:hypothetical protein [Patescibacteria group bacterium]
MRYRLGPFGEGWAEQPPSMESIADVFGFTRERMRQVEAEAIRKLRELSERPVIWYDRAKVHEDR